MSLSSSSLPQTADGVVKDVTLATFKADVVEPSLQTLVLVSFGATWEPSSTQLNVVLEKLARASKGAFRLAKVDIDHSQAIAQQMGVQEIPTVYAIFKGRPVDAFSGVLAEAQIKAWIENTLKTTGAGGEEKANLEAALTQAEHHLTSGEVSTAHALYSDILGVQPENAKAYAGLARCFVEEGNISKAEEMLKDVPPSIAKDKAFDAVRAALELAEQLGQNKGEAAELEKRVSADPADHQARFDLALTYYASGRTEEALDHLLEIVSRDRKWNDDGARKQLVKLFEALGATHPLTVSARKRLSSMLFS